MAMFSAGQIENQLQQNIPGSQVVVRDTVGDNNHFEAMVIASQFEGMTLVKRHQLVYAALGDAMKKEQIHALALKTLTPAQWQAAQ
jgi:acid stress-induced BolA-like protein IbaG/YrbA